MIKIIQRNRVMDVLFSSIQLFLKKNRSILQSQKGIVAPMFVGFLIALTVMFGFTWDIGQLLLIRHKIQGIADAGAIAGAMVTNVKGVYDASGNVIGTTPSVDLTAARNEVNALVSKYVNEMDLTASGVVINSSSVTKPSDKEICLEIDYTVETTLIGGLVGIESIQSVNMKARAKAEIDL